MAASAHSTVRSANPSINGLISDSQWSRYGIIYFSFPKRSADYASDYPSSNPYYQEPYRNFGAFNTAQRNAAYSILEGVSRLTDLTFWNSELFSQDPATADIRFGMTDDTEAAHAYLPGAGAGGDVWFNKSSGAYLAPVIGDYSYYTFLHEIGHALGLKHPHDQEAFGVMPLEHDNLNYTVMSYRSYYGMDVDAPYNNELYGFPQTFMIYDIASFQHMYGADYGTRSGDTVYAWAPGSGVTTIDGAPAITPGGNKIFLTIWDGGGTDTYDFSAYSDALSVDLAPGAWSRTAPGQLANLGDGHFANGNIANALLHQNNLASLIENAIGGSGNDTIYGNQGANRLVGGSGNDHLDGRGGADRLEGGPGDDRYFADDQNDVVVELAGEGFDEVTVTAPVFVAGENVEWITGTSAAAGQNLTGNSGDNRIVARNSGSDRLDGGGGADFLAAGDGNDTYVVDHGGDVIEDSGGTDTVIAYYSYALGAGMEHLTLAGSAAINGTGNDGANTITGNGSNNLLDGGGGADTLIGGLGDDYYRIDNGDSVVEAAGSAAGIDTVEASFSYDMSGGGVENLILTGTAAVGIGNALANRLVGNASANTLNGLGGADLMEGRGGNDEYVVDNAADVVSEANGDGEDRVASSVSFALPVDVEHLLLTGSAIADATGNNLNNNLRGNSAANRIDGGLGADYMEGMGGDDVYVVDNHGDVVSESGGSGTDIVYSSITFYLPFGVENLTLTGFGAIDGTGNLDANSIVGNDAANRLDGGAGADTLRGGLGDDVYLIDFADTVIENAGEGTDEIRTALGVYVLANHVENLSGTSGVGQQLTGNDAANLVTGANGNDVLSGGGGADTLRGGIGDDVYLIDAFDSVVEHAGDGTDEIRTSLAAYALGAEIEKLTGTSGSGQELTGNGGLNVLTGGGGDDRLIGLEGGDSFNGGAGTDTVDYSREAGGGPVSVNLGDAVGGLTALTRQAVDTYGATDSLSGVENIVTGGGDDSVFGDDLANRIETGAGNDFLVGRGGSDVLVGGSGDDIYLIRAADGATFDDVIVELAFGGTDEVRTDLAVLSLAGMAEIENLTGTGLGPQTLTGNGLDNRILGGAGNDRLEGGGGSDVLDGGGGADAMIGGTGDDLYFVDHAGDTAQEQSGEGADEVVTALAAYSIAGTDIEKLTGTSSTGQVLTSNLLANIVTSGAGADLLRLDQGGADNVSAGGGADAIIFGATLDMLDAVDGGAGVDQLSVQGDYWGSKRLVLGEVTNVEQIILLAGNNTAFGDPGTGFYSYELIVSDSNTAAGGLLQVDANRLRSGENFIFDGSAETDGAFFIWGGKGVDTITAGAGNDGFLFRGSGNWGVDDQVDGGAGSDQLGIRGNYVGAGAIVMGADQISGIEALILLSGTDIRFGPATAPTSYELTLHDLNTAAGQRMTIDAASLRTGETLTFDGSAESDGNFRIFGGQGADTIRGSANADTMRGGRGGDRLFGLGGDDVFQFRSADDVAGDRVDGGSGRDLLSFDGAFSNGVTFEAGALVSVEAIVLASSRSGYNAYNISMGGGNVAAGQVLLVDGSGLREGEGLYFDAINENAGSFEIRGGASRDYIFGSGGGDVLKGGLGADYMNGNGGADMFAYSTAGESSGTGFDQLVGFDWREDRIDVPVTVTGLTGHAQTGRLDGSTFDSDLAAAVDGLLEANSAVLFTAASGELAGRLFLVADANGDGAYQAGTDYVFELIAPAAPLPLDAAIFV